MNSKRMLIVVPNRGSSFIEQDVNILSKHFEVHCTACSPTRLPNIVASILQGSWDLVYLWFVLYYALPIAAACRAVGIPSVFVPAGVDLANEPEIGYGHMRFGFARQFTKTSLKLSSLVLPVSEFMQQRVMQVASPRAISVIYNGVNTERFTPKGTKHDIVLSVAKVSSQTVWYKRLDVIARTAKFLPGYRFILVGEHSDKTIQRLKQIAPQNVEFPGRVSDYDLLQLYQEARVYLQVSHSEAFGVALAEAMACECVPVVVRRGALPEVVGNSGYYAPYADPEGTAEKIKQAATQGNGTFARRRILQLFTIKRREQELIQALKDL